MSANAVVHYALAIYSHLSRYGSRNFSGSSWRKVLQCKAGAPSTTVAPHFYSPPTTDLTTAFPPGAAAIPTSADSGMTTTSSVSPVGRRYPVDSGCAIGPAAPDALSHSLCGLRPVPR